MRKTDYDFLVAEETRQALADEMITVLGCGDPRFRPTHFSDGKRVAILTAGPGSPARSWNAESIWL